MTTISIGNNGYINYSTIDNVCYDAEKGSISISTIFFDNLSSAFTTYTIDWSASFYEISADQIRDNGKTLINLKPDTYTFYIHSTSSSSSLGPYNIVINNGSLFYIDKIHYSNYSCGNNGLIKLSVIGGQPPYYFTVGDRVVTQTETSLEIDDLQPNTYDISVADSNSCVAINATDISDQIVIKNGTFSIIASSLIPPEILDGFGSYRIFIEGDGPFAFKFFNDNQDINFDSLDTTNLVSYDPNTNIYEYYFTNTLYPGTYEVIIKNNAGCLLSSTIIVPNIQPISVSISTRTNIANQNTATPKLILPIFDTIFIPFTHIQNNSELWQLIQECIAKNKIDIKIKNNIVEYEIVRSFLYPYCIDNNNIDIVRLDNNKDNWYFCFHIGAGINIANNLDLIDTDLYITDKKSNVEYKCVLGLENDTISKEFASLLIGSIIIPGIGDEYPEGGEAYIVVSQTTPQLLNSYNNNNIKNIHTNTYFNYYINGYSTGIYFLENFNVLSSQININESACTISTEDYQYIINIYELLLRLNNFNNYQNIYIFNKTFSSNTGGLSITINNNNSTVIQNGEAVDNFLFIDYYSFNDQDNKLYQFYKNNEVIKNTTALNNIQDGYIIIKIKDLNNNKVKFIRLNNSSTNTYDNHYVDSRNFIESYNSSILPFFEYGDILVHIPNSLELDNISGIGISNTKIVNNQLNPQYLSNIINQSGDNNDTATLNITTAQADAKCYLLGPKNYKHSFIGPTTFTNVIPGVYYIIGDEEYLANRSLYGTKTRVVVLKNQIYNINIKFISYLDQIFTKEI